MTTGTISDDVRVYLAAVRERLADLPAEEREHLLSDVEASLLEAEGEGELPLAARLGPPERFAAELRAAAGWPLPIVPAAAPPPSRGVRDALAGLARDERLRRTVRELAPLWWVARAYVAVAAVAVLLGAEWDRTFVFLPVLGEPALTAFALLLATVASVVIGMRRRTPAAAWVAANLAVLVVGVPLVAGDRAGDPPFSGYQANPPEQAVPVDGLRLDGAPVRNVYPYDRDGRLLQDVRLFDAEGAPLDVGGPAVDDPHRRVPATAGGRRAFNAFPIRYFEPGTRRVAEPGAGSPVHPRPLTSKPLR